MNMASKLVLLGVQCFLLMIATLVVFALVFAREETNNDVVYDITRQWGGPVEFNGIGTLAMNNESGPLFGPGPETYVCNANVDSKSLHRGIYEAEVFTADFDVDATFNKRGLELEYGDGKVLFVIDYDQDRMENLGPAIICGKEYPWILRRHRLAVEVDLADMPEDITLKTAFRTRGSRDLSIMMQGHTNNITIEGTAGNPSFYGTSLPIDREVDDKSFSADWEGGALNTSGDTQYASTSFLVGVDRYQKVTRSLKYSLVFIMLTYIAVVVAEILRRRPIPLTQYFLVGTALVIFYTLLLSFAELMTFGFAYLIAATMTASLISLFLIKALGSKKAGLTIGAILCALYGACYVMLCLSNYALLLGSLLLFGALATLMYATLINRNRALAPPPFPY